jgi:hypothetical protein
MECRKRIALIAHDHKKPDLLQWVRFKRDTLLKHELYATGTTGKIWRRNRQTAQGLSPLSARSLIKLIACITDLAKPRRLSSATIP